MRYAIAFILGVCLALGGVFMMLNLGRGELTVAVGALMTLIGSVIAVIGIGGPRRFGRKSRFDTGDDVGFYVADAGGFVGPPHQDHVGDNGYGGSFGGDGGGDGGGGDGGGGGD